MNALQCVRMAGLSYFASYHSAWSPQLECCSERAVYRRGILFSWPRSLLTVHPLAIVLTPLFLFCISEARRLPSVLAASLACCWVEWGIIYRTSLTSRMCFTNVRWRVYVISCLIYSLLLGLSGLGLSLWTETLKKLFVLISSFTILKLTSY